MVLDMLGGLVVLFFSMIIQVIIPPIPAELVVIGAGKLYGVVIAGLVAGAGLYVGSVLVYCLGFYLHKRFDTFFAKDKVKTIIARIRKYETTILWVRVLPYNPSDVISYAAGIMHFDKKKFLTITCITSFTRCFILAGLGSYIQNLQSVFVVVAVLLLSLLVAHWIVYKRG